jgi:hypothetical protein
MVRIYVVDWLPENRHNAGLLDRYWRSDTASTGGPPACTPDLPPSIVDGLTVDSATLVPTKSLLALLGAE